MKNELMAALAPQEEKMTFYGKTLLIRELECAADLSAFANNEDANWKLLVRSVFDEKGDPVWDDSDIPALKKRSMRRMSALVSAVQRINGSDTDDIVKKSAPSPDIA